MASWIQRSCSANKRCSFERVSVRSALSVLAYQASDVISESVGPNRSHYVQSLNSAVMTIERPNM
jgi:hypothetical protein